MIFLLFFSFWSFSFAETPQSLIVSQKFYLKKQVSYHFSAKDLISTHIKGPHPFIVGLKVGLLEYEENGLNKKLYILTPKQHSFFTHVQNLVFKSPFLNFKIENEKLIVTGKAHNIEKKILLKQCIQNFDPQIKLDFLEPAKITNKFERSCLEKTFNFHQNKIFVLLTSKNSSLYKSFGLGAPISRAWALTDKFSFSNLVGELGLGTSKTFKNGDSFLSGTLSPDSDFDFETGYEVGIQSRGFFSNQPIDWKKATTHFKFSVVDKDHQSTKLNMEFTNNSPTTMSQTFNSERFSQKLLISHNKWIKVLDYKTTGTGKSLGGVLGISLLGVNAKEKSNQTKELWIRIEDDHIY